MTIIDILVSDEDEDEAVWVFPVMEDRAQREVSRVYPSGYPSI